MARKLAWPGIFLLAIALLLSGCAGGGGKDQKTFVLTMTKRGEGSTVPDIGKHKYSKKAVASLKANPAAGWEFSHWEGGVAERDKSQTSVYIDQDKIVKVVFIPKELPLGQAVPVLPQSVLRFENGSMLDFSKADVPGGTTVTVRSLSEEITWPSDLRPVGPVLQVTFNQGDFLDYAPGSALSLPVLEEFDQRLVGIFWQEGAAWEHQPSAFENGMLSTAVTSKSIYAVLRAEQATAPQAEPAEGKLDPGSEIALHSSTPGSQIYISTGGKQWPQDFVPYISPLVMPQGDLAFYAVARKSNMIPSEVLHFQYGEAAPSGQVYPTVAFFDQHPARQADVVLEITWNMATSVVNVINTADGQDTVDYLVDGNRLIIAKEYLAVQQQGGLEFAVQFDQGSEARFSITIREPVALRGFAQIGPYVLNSTVTIEELDQNLQKTGQACTTRAINPLGEFTVAPDFVSDYVEISVAGKYFNPIRGVTDGPFTLKGIADVRDDRSLANINLLTTLARDRIVSLAQQGIPVPEAKERAEREVLAMIKMINANGMDISGDGEGDAPLLALTLIVMGESNPYELERFVSALSQDLRDYGHILDSEMHQRIRENAMGLDLARIRESLHDRYAFIGVPVTLPPFEDYIDRLELFEPLGQIKDSRPVFSWTPSAFANATYELQVATDQKFDDLMYAVMGISGSSYKLDQGNLANHGKYYWRVLVEDSRSSNYSWAESLSFTVDIGVEDPLAPRGSIADTKPVIEWTSSDLPNVTYHVQVAMDSTFQDIIDENMHCEKNCYELEATLENLESYAFRVAVIDENGVEGDWSSSGVFTVDLGTVEVTGPVGTTSATKPEITWAVSPLSNCTYHVQIAEDPAFTSIVDQQDNLDAAPFLPTVVLDNESTYYCRVAVIDRNGVRSAWSDTQEFTVDMGTVELITSSSRNSKPTVAWTASPLDDVRYRVQIAYDDTFTDIIDQADDLLFTEYQPTIEPLANLQSCYYRVSVIDENQVQGSWSAPQEVVVDLGAVTPLTSRSQDSRPMISWSVSDLPGVTYHV